MVFQATKIRAFEKLLLCFDEEKEVLSCNVKGVHLYLLFLMLNCAHCYHLQPSNWLTIHTVRVISPLVALACSWQCSLYLYVKISILKKHTFVRVDVASYFVNLQQPTNNLAYTSEGEQRVNIVWWGAWTIKRKRMPLVLAVLISATLGNQPDIIGLQYYAHIMQYVTLFCKIYNVIWSLNNVIIGFK